MWVGAKEGVSQNKPRKSARRRVLELEISPWEGTGRKLALGGTPASRGKGLRDSLRGRGGIGAGSPSAGSGARESPPPHGPALCSPRSIWGCRPLVAAIAAASRAVPRQARAAAWPRAGGPLSSSSPPPPGSGPTAGARGGGPAARGDRNLASQRRGSLPISPRPGLFRSRQRRRRLLPDAPAGACSREERERPVRPGLEAPAAAAAATRSTGPASRVRGALTGARAPSGGGPGRWGPRDNRRRAHGFRFRFCLPGPGRIQRARARARPRLPRRLFGPLPRTSGSRLTRDPSAALGSSSFSPPLACTPPLESGSGGEKVVLRGGGRWGAVRLRDPHPPPHTATLGAP